MAIVNIPFGALALNTSEASAAQGALARSSALLTEHANGGLQPVFPPSEATAAGGGSLLLPAGAALEFIHTTALYRHLIITGGDKGAVYVAWLHDDGTSEVLLTGLSSVTSITAIGNTLLVSAPEALHYLLYRPTEGKYGDLGTHLPLLPISFALSSELLMQYFQNTGLKVKERPNTTDAEGRVLISSLQMDVDNPDAMEEVDFNDSPGWYEYVPHPAFSFDPSVELDFKTYTYALRFKKALSGGALKYAFLTGTPVGSSERKLIYYFQNGSTLRTVTLRTDNKTFFYGSTDTTYNNLRLVIETTDHSAHAVFLLRGDGAYTPKMVDQSSADALNAVLGVCARFVSDQATERRRFAYPFFVRYGYRLFDGSIFPLSDPVLMLPTTGPAPHVYYSNSDTVTLYVMGVVSQLLYRLQTGAAEQLAKLKTDWRDVVTGLVISVSPPIYTYNQGAEWQQDKDLLPVSLAAREKNGETTFYDTDAGFSVSRFSGITGATAYSTYDYSSVLFRRGFGAAFVGDLYEISPPTYTDEELKEKVLSSSTFYVCSEMTFDEVATAGTDSALQGFTALNIKKGVLETLVTREAVADAYLSRTELAAGNVYAYSSRLNLAGVTERLAAPTPMPLLGGWEKSAGLFVELVVRLDTTDGYRYVRTRLAGSDLGLALRYFYYPDTRAVEAFCFAMMPSTTNAADRAIVAQRLVPMAARFSLTRHDFLQGAQWFDDFAALSLAPDDLTLGWSDLSTDFGSALSPQAIHDKLAAMELPDTEEHAAEVFTSAVDNPWYFPAEGRNAVGSGKVLAIVANATALTQEQYGSHPLYAFCTDGIWALGQNEQGSYVQVQPVSRNVLLSADALVQLDSAIAYCTARGVYLLSGLRSDCISEALIDASRADLSKLAGFGSGGPFYATTTTLRDYLDGACLAYDYMHARLWVFSPAEDKSLVYSFRSRMWGTAPVSFARAVNAFPDSYLQGRGDDARRIYSLMQEPADAGTQTAVLVTRPFRLADVATLCTPRVVGVRGDVEPRQVSLALYGARTLGRWHLLGSVKSCNMLHLRTGSPYRYFRLAVKADMRAGQSLEGATVTAIGRDINQQR